MRGQGTAFVQDALFFSQSVAENPIDQASQAGGCQVNRFINRCMVRHAQQEKLAEAQLQDDPRLVVQSPLTQGIDHMVEPALMPENAEDQGLDQMSVSRGQFRPGAFPVHQGFCEGAVFIPVLQAVQGDLSGGDRMFAHWSTLHVEW